MRRPAYKVFTWQSSQGQAALLTPDLVHSWYTAVKFLAISLISPAVHTCALLAWATSFLSSSEALVRGLLQVPLPRPPHQEEERNCEELFSALTQYFSTPSPTPPFSYIHLPALLFGIFFNIETIPTSSLTLEDVPFPRETGTVER